MLAFQRWKHTSQQTEADMAYGVKSCLDPCPYRAIHTHICQMCTQIIGAKIVTTEKILDYFQVVEMD